MDILDPESGQSAGQPTDAQPSQPSQSPRPSGPMAQPVQPAQPPWPSQAPAWTVPGASLPGGPATPRKAYPARVVWPIAIGALILIALLVGSFQYLENPQAARLFGGSPVQTEPPGAAAHTLLFPESFGGYVRQTGSAASALISAMRERAASTAKSPMWARAFSKAPFDVYERPGHPILVVIGFSERMMPEVFAQAKSEPPATRVASFMAGAQITNARNFPAGPLGGVLSCGSRSSGAATITMCYWSDWSTAAATMQPGVPPGELARVTLALRNAAEY